MSWLRITANSWFILTRHGSNNARRYMAVVEDNIDNAKKVKTEYLTLSYIPL